MGIIAASPKAPINVPATNGKRRSMQADFAKLKPLNPNGLKGFSTFRDPSEKSATNGVSGRKAGKKRQTTVDSDDEDAENENEVEIKTKGDDMQEANGILSAEDAKRQGELAQGVQKIRVSFAVTDNKIKYVNIFQLKRQHSAGPADSPSPAPAHRKSPDSNAPTAGSTPPYVSDRKSPPPLLPSTVFDAGALKASDDFMIGSPLKKQRASLSGIDEESLRAKFGLGVQGDVLGRIEQDRAVGPSNVGPVAQDPIGLGDSLGSIAQEKVVFGGQLGEQQQQAVKTEEMEEEL